MKFQKIIAVVILMIFAFTVQATQHIFLPPTISGPFTVEFEAKCLYSSHSDVDDDKVLLSISGNTGTADADTNNFYIQVASDGKLSANLYDSADTVHSLTTAADPVDFSEWFRVKAYYDLSDLTTMDMWIDGSNASITKVGNTGSAAWSTLFNELRIGQDYSSSVTSDCRIRNLRISPK